MEGGGNGNGNGGKRKDTPIKEGTHLLLIRKCRAGTAFVKSKTEFLKQQNNHLQGRVGSFPRKSAVLCTRTRKYDTMIQTQYKL